MCKTYSPAGGKVHIRRPDRPPAVWHFSRNGQIMMVTDLSTTATVGYKEGENKIPPWLNTEIVTAMAIIPENDPIRRQMRGRSREFWCQYQCRQKKQQQQK